MDKKILEEEIERLLEEIKHLRYTLEEKEKELQLDYDILAKLK